MIYAMTIKVGLFGFGKTGKVVAEEIIKDPECRLEWIIRKSRMNEGDYAGNLLGLNAREGKIFSANSISDTFYQKNYVDIIVDFSSPNAVDDYGKSTKYGTKIISAISKYDSNDLDTLRKLGKKTAVIYSPNITLGINFLIAIANILKQIIPDADVEIVEEHSKSKKETSGTALKIAENLGLDKEKHINSIRIGGIVSKHEVIFGLPNQIIRLIHETTNRAAFGIGALYAAKWLVNQKKGLYTMEEIITDSIVRNLKLPDLPKMDI